MHLMSILLGLASIANLPHMIVSLRATVGLGDLNADAVSIWSMDLNQRPRSLAQSTGGEWS